MANAQQARQTGSGSLPFSSEAEASVLGAIIIDTNALVKIADKISADDFYDQRHHKIYAAITELYEENKDIDVLTISNQLRINGFLDEVGGQSYLAELTNFVPTAAHVESYATLVVEKAVRRRLIGINKKIAELVGDESKKLKDLIEIAESELMKVGSKEVKQTIVSLESILAESFERLDDLHKDTAKIRGVTTGFSTMDDMLAGLQKSDLFILAARPSMGKAQPLDAKILTTTGWKRMGNIRVGDSLASLDGQPSTVTDIFPQGIKQIYKVTFCGAALKLRRAMIETIPI
jgi:replicative DNA helicase